MCDLCQNIIKNNINSVRKCLKNEKLNIDETVRNLYLMQAAIRNYDEIVKL